MEFRFLANRFSLEYRLLTESEINHLSQHMSTDFVRGRTTFIKFTLYPDCEPQMVGFSWPGEYRDQDFRELKAALQYQLAKGEFHVLTRSTADGNIRGGSQPMALKGYA